MQSTTEKRYQYASTETTLERGLRNDHLPILTSDVTHTLGVEKSSKPTR